MLQVRYSEFFPRADGIADRQGFGADHDGGASGVPTPYAEPHSEIWSLVETAAGTAAEAAGGDGGVAEVPDLPADTSTTASIAIGETFSGELSPAGDSDWVRVELVAGQSYVFTMSGVNNTGLFDPYLELHSASGVLLAVDDDGAATALNSQLRFTAPTSGTYYLGARTFTGENQAATAGNYLLTADIGPAQDPVDAIRWGTSLSGSTVNVYFAPAGVTYDGFTSTGWSQSEIDAAFNALQQVSNVANLSFTQVFSDADADFRLITVGSAEFGGRMSPPNTVEAGLGIFNTSRFGWGAGLIQGGAAFYVLLHEFGHGLGLAHPHDNGGSSEVLQGVIDPDASFGSYGLNQGVFTNMTYNEGWWTAPHGRSTAATYGYQGGMMALDIAALQGLYGPNMSYHAGADTYLLPAANTSGTYYTAIWDAGGTDTISAEGVSLDVVIDLRPATLLGEAGGGGFVSFAAGVHGGFTIANGVVIEDAIGGSGRDTITGNSSMNVIYGGGGRDVIDGGGGADTINGEGGSDTIDGGGGSDTINGQGGSDTIGGGGGSDSIFGGGGNDAISGGSSADAINGNSGDDTINGNSGDDIINGGADRDTVHGGPGDDVLYGAQGHDVLDGDGGDDTIYGNSGSDDLFGGSGADELYGGGLNDALSGEAGDDMLIGGSGNDVLNGGAGADQLSGNSGTDRFLFTAITDSGTTGGTRDQILDFHASQGDLIDVSGVDANAGVGGDQAFSIVGAFTGAAGQMTMSDVGGGVTRLAFDVGGDGVADMEIDVHTVNILDADDFIL